MKTRFSWSDLYSGNRFLAPLSEEALLQAAAAAGVRDGWTVFEVACGNGAAAVFLAEEFHVYVRGVEAAADLVASARRHAERSAACTRVRFFHGDAAHVDPANGPVDMLCSLRGTPGGAGLLRPDGRLLQGRYRLAEGAPPELRALFPEADHEGSGAAVWRREATPLEWERFYEPQERALRAHGDSSPIAAAAARQIEAFRAHGSQITYELTVTAPTESC